jgi:hypothetical protein
VAAEAVNSGRLGGGLATVCHLHYPACSWSKFLWLQLQKKKSFYGIRADKGGPLKISTLPLFLGPTLAIRCICQVFLLRNIPCDQSRYWKNHFVCYSDIFFPAAVGFLPFTGRFDIADDGHRCMLWNGWVYLFLHCNNISFFLVYDLHIVVLLLLVLYKKVVSLEARTAILNHRMFLQQQCAHHFFNLRVY